MGQSGTMPQIVEKNGRHALMVDGQPFFMLGGQAHNSSSWPGMLPQVWSAVKAMNANTLEVPVYWEQIEPQPGKFDFSLIDTF
jgi:beta-galactosidase GanA